MRLGRIPFIFLPLLMIANSAFGIESSLYRQDKKSYIVGEAGYSVVPLLSKGFSAGLGIDPTTAIEVNYAQGYKNVKYDEMFSNYYALRVKKFFGNSFYANLGVAHRQVMDRTTDRVSRDFYVERRGRSTGVDITVGNRWQFDNLTIGCDWLGWYEPFTMTRNESFVMKRSFAAAPEGSDPGGHGQHGGGSEHGGHDHGSSYDRHQNDWDRLSKYGTLQALRVSLGLAF
jgi:hypothetical protein